jgi:hypothetical protein
VAKPDLEAARKRVAEHYASLTEFELRPLAENAWSLTDSARLLLEAEVRRRGFEIQIRGAADDVDHRFQTLVILRNFRDVPEALLAQSILDSAEIECFLFDENVIRMYWFWSNLLGGVKLVVREVDASDALELLNQKPIEKFYATGTGEYNQPRCPQCDSLSVTFGGTGKRLSYITIALGVPLPVARSGWKCDSCGHKWDETEYLQGE